MHIKIQPYDDPVLNKINSWQEKEDPCLPSDSLLKTPDLSTGLSEPVSDAISSSVEIDKYSKFSVLCFGENSN